MIELARIEAHVAALADIRARVYGDSAPLGFEVRRRYAVVFSRSGAFRSAIEFIDLETGDIYRADSWRARGRLMQKAGVQ